MRSLVFLLYLASAIILTNAGTASARSLGPLQAEDIGTKPILLMIHPSRVYDRFAEAKIGINETYEFARKQGFTTYLLQSEYLDQLNTHPVRPSKFPGWFEVQLEPAVPLQHNASWTPFTMQNYLVAGRNHSYYMDETPPSAYIFSREGEHGLIAPSQNANIILTGGYLEQCMQNAITVMMINSMVKNRRPANITFTIVKDATYTHCDNHLNGYATTSATVENCFAGQSLKTIEAFFRDKFGSLPQFQNIFTANFFINGTSLPAIGSGPAQINFRFIKSTDLPSVFPKIPVGQKFSQPITPGSSVPAG